MQTNSFRTLKRAKRHYVFTLNSINVYLNGDGRISREEWVKQCPCFDAEKEYWPLVL